MWMMDEPAGNENILPNNGEETSDVVNNRVSVITSYKSLQNGSSHSSSISTASSDLGCYPTSPDTDIDNNFTNSPNHTVSEVEYNIPILGYEISEEKARFTVFKIQVNHKVSGESWHIYRRYTDFIRLNKKLKIKFPECHLMLPPKRWFGDNFDASFLEDRLLGLQKYVNRLITNKKLCLSPPVREFFCLDDPPAFDENIEFRCESLEDAVYKLQHKLKEKQEEVDVLKAELALCKVQLATMLKSIKLETSLSSFPNHSALSPSLENLNGIKSALLHNVKRSISPASPANLPLEVPLSRSTPDLKTSE